MQLSKLTFSLASLVLMFALVFATTPAMAATGGPTVTFVDDEFPDDATRGSLKVKVTFDPAVLVGDDLTATDNVDGIGPDDLQYRLKNGAGDFITASADFDSVARTTTTNTGDTDDGFTFTVDITNATATTGAITDARSIVVQVPADVASAADPLGGAGLGNQAASKSYALPSIHADAFAKLEAAEDGDATATYDLTITFVDDAGTKLTAAGTLGTTPLTVDDLQVMPKGGVVFGDFATPASPDPDENIVYTVTVILRGGVNTATISVDSGFAAAAEMDGSVEVSVLSTLATPMKPTFTVNADRTVSLNWDDVTGAGSYMVTQAGTAAATYPATGASPITASEFTTPALAVGTYTFTVKAMSDSAVDSAASPASDDVVVAGTPPTVTVSLVSGSLDVTDKEFLVDFEFVAMPGEAAVPDGLMADYIKVTTDAAGMTDARIPDPMVEPLRGAGNFRATIDYTGATLPLYVSLIEADSMATPPVMGVDVSAITYGTDATATSLMVDAPNVDPTFPATTPTMLTVAEEQPVGTNVGAAFTANDTDTLTYSLSGTDAASFTIDGMGQLKTAVVFNYEAVPAKTSYSVTVTASDGKGGTDASIDVTINVTDVADTVVPPTVTISLVSHDEAMKTFQVRFAFAAATVAPTVGTAGPVPTDFMASAISVMKAGATAGTMVAASIPEDLLVTKLRTGEWVATIDYSLDTDGLPLYVSLTDPSTVSMINGMAADGATTPALTVEATPVNADPTFPATTVTTLTVAENAAVGTAVGAALTANDTDPLTYSLSGTDAAAFTIGLTTGQLMTAVALDYETKMSYSVTVTASDGKGGMDASIDVTINVTDVADTVVPPTVTISLVSHDEAMKTFQVRFAFAAATVAPTVGTAGPVPTDFMASAISVMKAGATAGTMVAASIPEDLLVTKLRTGEWVATIDYSLDTDGLPLHVSLTDPSTVSMINGMAADGTPTPALTVEATPVNAAPVFTDGTSATRTVVENTAAGTAIGTPVAAMDADTGDTLTFTLGGTDAASFAIVATSGQLQTSAALDYETKNSYSVSVMVSDGNGGMASIPVTINVTNDTADDNNAPMFAAETATRSVAENTAAGMAIGDPVAATDADTGDTLTFTLGGTDAASFAIVATSGQLQTSAALDYETKNSYSVSVMVSDGNGGTDSIAVTISVTDVVEDDEPADETDPVVAIVPVVGDKTAAFDVTFTVTEANLATTDGVKVAITPADAVTDATPAAMAPTSGNAYTVTVTPIAPTTDNRDITGVPITITVTATDAAGNSGMASIAVQLGNRAYTPPAPADTTDPTVAVTPIAGAQSAAFDVMITATDETSTLTAASISVAVTSTNTGTATYTVGDVTAGTAANTYTVTITPTAATTATITEETLNISVTATDAAGNDATQSIAVTLAERPATSTTPTTGDVTIASKGYAVLVNPGATAAQHGIQSSVDTIEYDLPNLYEFFRDSGTIVLNGSSGTAFGAVRMTEIMWGEDAALVANSSMSQWIEIQNTTAAAITVNFGAAGGWSLTFKRAEYDNSTADAVDRISNLGNPGRWNVPGQSGRSVASGNDAQVELVSMVRKHTDARSHRSDGWEAAIRPSLNIAGARIANPGAAKAVVIVSGSSPTIDRGTVYISEIGNLGDGEDWIELYNASDSAANIKNWIISVVEADRVAAAARTSDGPLTKGNQEGNGIDREVVQFGRATYEDALKIPAKSYLLVTAKDPADSDSPLAVGINLQNTRVNRDPKDNQTTGQTHLYYVASGLKIPNEAALVILRNHHEKEGVSSHFRDIVNIGDYVGQSGVDVNIAGKWNTEVWPLQSTRKPGDRENVGAGANAVIQRDRGTDRHWAHKDLWSDSPFTGLGYDRDVSKNAMTEGTPGYANGGGIDKIAGLSDGDITISEIMYANGNGRVPQWVELYNSSMTRSVNLNGWDLEINNVDSEDIMSNEYINRRITLGDVKVLPNQTVLIVSTSGRNTSRAIFPDHRIFDLSASDAFGRENRLDPILSSTGFNVALYDKDDKPVDEAGNIDNNRRTNDDPAWALPNAETADGRTSIIRRYKGGEAGDGTMEDAWILASETNLAYLNVGDLYYGRSTDISTPGFRGGGPLPVSLSKFRPERLDDGSIVVRWVTESELDNAGFNILRSDTSDGEFTKLNEQLIAGHGTTSERNSYEWTDTSAKPNVVYYYQIQDVSLDGDVATLRTTRLKGHISAAGKLTTTWGDLKLQD